MNQNISQQAQQCENVIHQLMQQTQQGTNLYQQLLHQVQQNEMQLEGLLQKENQASQMIKSALQGHQMAMQQMQQADAICRQISQTAQGTSTNYSQVDHFGQAHSYQPNHVQQPFQQPRSYQ